MSSLYTIHEIGPEDFPAKLREIPDPPARLFYRGARFNEDVPALVVVGSRKMTDYGRRACEALIEGLRGYSVQIISGLAFGIDSVAHRAALKNNLTTVAVPGSGVHNSALYPRAHLNLGLSILEKGGTILSEFPPQQKPFKGSFPQRNRIMAGLAEAVLLVEAAEKSGTLITGRLALEYNREVCVVPGEIFSSTSRGTNALLYAGATPILSSQDLIDLLNLEQVETADTTGAKTDHPLLALFTKDIDKDELLRQTDDPQTALVELSKLEILGLIEIVNNRVFKKVQ